MADVDIQSREFRTRAALEAAESFIETVTHWTGQQDDMEETLAEVRAAQAIPEDSVTGGVELERLADELDARAKEAEKQSRKKVWSDVERAQLAGGAFASREAASLLRESQGATDDRG